MGLIDLLKGSVVVEEAAPITEMTSEDYCKISREYKQKAIGAMKRYFETRVKEKMFCVGDYVKPSKTFYEEFANVKPDFPKEKPTNIMKVVEISGVWFAQIEYITYNINNAVLWRFFVPFKYLEADWKDNNPERGR